MIKKKERIKELGWQLFNDKRGFKQNILIYLHLLKLEQSEYYTECIKFYSNLNVNGKTIFDIGSDFGTSPLYFINQGALKVLGISGMNQYFRHPKYHQMPIRSFTDIYNLQRILKFNILKSDSEGFEWNFTQEFIESFEDWIIACHYPIKNSQLFEYLKHHGKNIGSQPGCEFAIYKKVIE